MNPARLVGGRMMMRAVCGAIVGCFAMAMGAAHAADEPFSFATLRERAKTLATRPHATVQTEVPAWLRNLDYDQLRRIEFNGGHSLWHGRKLPFEVQFLHPGFIHIRTVNVHELYAGRANPIAFNRDHFNYQEIKVGEIPTSMGF